MRLRPLFLVFTLSLSFSAMASEALTSSSTLQQGEKMLTVRIMVAKFRELILSIHDINKLESIGMPHADAELMRLTLQEKIRQAQTQTIDSIRRLNRS